MMDTRQYSETESKIIETLRTIYDPEIPVNIYDLGLIYKVVVDDEKTVNITMTLTSPNCPMADQLLEEVREKTGSVEGIEKVNLKLTFNPPWNPDNLSDEVKLELGFL
jgi:FeS assembly SUF system protein